MKKIFTPLPFLLAFGLEMPTNAQTAPGIQWQNTIGASSTDALFAVKPTTDGGYILAGESASNASGDKTENSIGLYDYWVVKTDAAGVVQWENTIGGTGTEHLYSMDVTVDGGAILGGFSNSNISGDKTENSMGDYDYWIVKLDSLGSIQWENTIGGSLGDYLYAIVQTTDGGYFMAGSTNSDSSGDKTENAIGGSVDIWIVKTDASGNIQWQNTIGGTGGESPFPIQQASDGGFIIGGFSNSNISGDKTENCIGVYDFWLIKTDSTGTVQWENTIGGTNDDEIFALDQAADGGYILAGTSNSNISGDKTENSHGLYDYWVVKTDALGTIQWQNTIGGNNYDDPYAIRQTGDGGYVVGGPSESNISGDKTENSMGATDFWLLKLDSLGSIVWQNTIGGNNSDQLFAVQNTSDNGFILGGSSASGISGDKTENSNGLTDYWIVKLYPDTITGLTLVPSVLPAQVFPNPASEFLNIKFGSEGKKKVTIFNTMGALISEMEVHEDELSIPIGDYAEGIYSMQIVQGSASRQLAFTVIH